MKQIRRRSIAASLLAISVSIFGVNEYLHPSYICCPLVFSVVAEVTALNGAVIQYKEESGNLPEGLAQVSKAYELSEKGARRDFWGNEFVYHRSADRGRFVLYSIGRNKLDEKGGGDDVVAGPKQYSCKDYGVNCPPSWPEIVRMASLGSFALSLLFLALLAPATIIWRKLVAVRHAGSSLLP
ncbi:MAG: hypothetical protein ACJ8GW_08305 [Massilia sp.]